MPEYTDAMLANLDTDEFWRISGIRIADPYRYLGSVGITHYWPSFSRDFSGALSPDSRFTLRIIQHAIRDEPVAFIIFRQFDSSQYQAFPEDLHSGWVPIALVPQAREWVLEMNLHIEWLLERERNPQPGGAGGTGPYISLESSLAPIDFATMPAELTVVPSRSENLTLRASSGAPAEGRLCGYCLSDQTRVICHSRYWRSEPILVGSTEPARMVTQYEWRCLQCKWFTHDAP
jgi:hypothetical protein